MRAHVGDRLVAAADSGNAGLIVSVLGEDGQPPYVVKWLRSGHIAMISPDAYARIIPAGTGSGPGRGDGPPPEAGAHPEPGDRR